LEKQIMIRNNKYLIVAGAAALGVSMYSATATAATVTADASANVLEPLGITQAAAMDFGDVAADPLAATTVELTTGGTTSSPDGASVGGTPAAGSFDVTGAANAAYDISLPADGTVVLNGAGTAMPVDSFTSSVGTSSTLDGTGAENFTVGAILTINANQAAGNYTGTYDVNVNYQ
jgi:hypothetical protein